jgi:transposase
MRVLTAQHGQEGSDEATTAHPEQIIRKLREADRLLAEGREVPEVAKHLEAVSLPWLGMAGFVAMTTLVDKLVPDELWRLVKPLLPPPPRPPYGGRHRTIPERNCFAAIVYMARTSTPWRLLPAKELGCGSPATAWRRLAEWAKAGVFEQLHLEILDRLGEQGRLAWSRASMDSASVRAKRGGIMWAQIRSIAASQGPRSTWSARGAGCR